MQKISKPEGEAFGFATEVNMSEKILIVEDERSIADILAFNISRAGYEPVCAYDGAEGLHRALSDDPDIILLDVMLPEMDGFEVCRRVRESGSAVPIIMLTAREEEADKVLGLDLGADDYITKPFSMAELMARVRANLRRGSMAPAPAAGDPDVISVGELRIDPHAEDVFRDGKAVGLTHREFELIYFLAQARGRVVTREDLMNKVWEFGGYGDARTVDVTIRRLREKVETDPAEPTYILTKRGLGYMMA